MPTHLYTHIHIHMLTILYKTKSDKPTDGRKIALTKCSWCIYAYF